MKKLLFILAGVIVIIALAAVVYYVTRPLAPAPEEPTTDPFGQVGGSGGGAVAPSYTVRNAEGAPVTVPDFRQFEQPERAGNDLYQVAAGADFQILYFPNDSFFLVSLTAEPLSQARTNAEAALVSALRLTADEVCALAVSVQTSADVNEYYAGSDLGLTFCPNYIALP